MQICVEGEEGGKEGEREGEREKGEVMSAGNEGEQRCGRKGKRGGMEAAIPDPW